MVPSSAYARAPVGKHADVRTRTTFWIAQALKMEEGSYET